MSEPARHDEGAVLQLADEARAAPSTKPDPVDAWLDVFVRLLRFPEAERAAVRDELESHLRERVRDLVLKDMCEAEAQCRAIAELGDAAELARRYVEAKRSPIRRRLMNGLVAMTAGAALITSIVAVNQQPQPVRMVAYETPAAKSAPSVTVPAMTFERRPLLEVIDAVGKAAQRTAHVRSAVWEAAGVKAETLLSLKLQAGTLDSALRQINDTLGNSQPQVDWRVTEAGLDVATREYFDRAETKLVSMDLGSFLSGPNAKPEALASLITQMVEPDGWVDNGGDTSRMHIVGQKLFVKAPPRVCEQVAWVVERVNDNGGRGAEAGKGAAAGSLSAATSAASRAGQFEAPAALAPAKAAADPVRADSLAQRRRAVQREIAWKKVQLGQELTPEERTWMDDNRAVHAVGGPDGPARDEVEEQLRVLRLTLDRLDADRAGSERGVPAEAPVGQFKVTPIGR